MPPRPSPSESQELQAWKAREFDRRNLELQEEIAEKVARLEREFAVHRAKLGLIAVFTSAAFTMFFHYLLPIFLPHK